MEKRNILRDTILHIEGVSATCLALAMCAEVKNQSEIFFLLGTELQEQIERLTALDD